MPKRRQVGGMQEVFIQLSGKSASGIERAIKAIESAGGRVLHAYPPSVLVASVPAESVGELAGKAGIATVETGSVSLASVKSAVKAAGARKAGHILDLAYAAWNNHVSPERRLAAMANSDLNKPWDSQDRLPPHPPKAVSSVCASVKPK